MSKRAMASIRRPGGFLVKAAESRPAKVIANPDSKQSAPTSGDRSLARAVLKTKRG